MKKSLILLLALSSVAAFGAASDTFESELAPYNQAVRSGDFYGIFAHHALLRGFDTGRAYRINQKNVTLLKDIIDAKPSDHFLSNTLELFEPNSSVHQIIQAQDWQALRQEIDNLEQAQASTQTQHLTEEENIHAMSFFASRIKIAGWSNEKLAAMLATKRTRNFAEQITWGEWNIKNTLASKCRLVLAQHPERVLDALQMLHATDECSTDRFLLFALCVNNGLINRIGMLYQTLKNSLHFSIRTYFSPDNNTLATSMHDRTVRLWNVHDGNEIKIMPTACCATFSPDGNYLAYHSGTDTILRLTDMKTNNEVKIFQGHTGIISSIAFNTDGSLLASGSADNTVRLWSVSTDEQHRILKGHVGWVYSVAFSPDGNILASASEDMAVRLWNVHTGKQIGLLQGSDNEINSVAFSPDGNILASTSGISDIALWDVHTHTQIKVLKRQPLPGVNFGGIIIPGETMPGMVSSVAFSPDGKTLGVTSTEGAVCFWDVAGDNYKIIAHLSIGCIANSITFSSDGNMFAYTTSSRGTRLVKQYTRFLLSITNQQEQTFLLNAALDWLNREAHIITPKNKTLYESLIKRFTFLNNPQLFKINDDSCIIA